MCWILLYVSDLLIVDRISFITVSHLLENVGTSAYLGGAPLITDKTILGAAGSILVTEALHTSLQRNALNAVVAPSPNGTPLDPNAVFSLASQFIKQCPTDNEKLPFKTFPKLTATTQGGTCEGPDCTPSTFSKRSSTNVGLMKRTDPRGTSMPNDMMMPHKPASMMSSGRPKLELNPAAPALPNTFKDIKCVGGGSTGRTIPSTTTSSATPPAQTSCSTGGSGSDSSRASSGSSSDITPPEDDSVKSTKALRSGIKASFTAEQDVPDGSFLTFVAGLTVTSVKADRSDGKTVSCNIPDTATGQTYIFLTKDQAKDNKFDVNSVLQGPAVMEIKPADPQLDNNEA